MWPFERHAGCPPDAHGCMGPVGPHHSLFGTELPMLAFHLEAALALTLLLVGVLTWRKRRGALSWSWARIAGLGAFAAPALFFLLAWAFPLTLQY